MEAPDARAVVERLQRDAYFPIKIDPQGQRRGPLGLAWRETARARVAGRDLVSLTQQLATLIEAGLPLDRALAIQAELAPTSRLRTIMGDVLRSVQGGSSLADALGRHHPRPFSRLYINMVRAGERGGVLETTLRRLAGFLEESQEFRDAREDPAPARRQGSVNKYPVARESQKFPPKNRPCVSLSWSTGNQGAYVYRCAVRLPARK
jgi:type II secretory pathway component PulF